MATFTPKEGYALMNQLVKQATGQQAVTAVDASTFVSAGSLVLETGLENVFNSLNVVLGRLIIASRPYKAKLKMMDAIGTDGFTNRIRKVSYYAGSALPSGNFNTDLFTNLAEGYTSGDNNNASTKSQYEQHRQIPLEMTFGNTVTWQDCITMDEDAVKAAFRDVNEFNKFIAGYLTEHANDIESQREAWNRLALLNKIGMVYDMKSVMPGSVINLTSAYNTKYGTSYTSAELRTTYIDSFLEFFITEFKLASDRMTERSLNYHWSPVKTGATDLKLLRHTPKDKQRAYLFNQLFTEARTAVMPNIFNPQYLDLNTSYEAVDYWQANDTDADRAAVKVTPAVVDTTTGAQKAGEAVDLPYVVGMITDVDGLLTDFQLEVARTTPVEARKGYRNTWLTFAKGIICDPTENCVLFIMKDGE